MTHFYTKMEAANAMAAARYPEDQLLRIQVAGQYEGEIYTDLCDGRLVGRCPSSRLPIKYRGLAGALMFNSCLISADDLNGWLDARGVGFQVSDHELASEDTGAVCLPPDVELLAEQQALKDDHAHAPNVKLAEKYGVKPRHIKDHCTAARKAVKASKISTTSYFPNSQFKKSSR
ncbi:hypothetical protein ABH944_007784 [Caballeronia udeis]|uniref:Uncharacterized protein n=1 Tax=Caballeronia udeis TaxID=1232866 RepID=A0ABW8MUR6_9BURK